MARYRLWWPKHRRSDGKMGNVGRTRLRHVRKLLGRWPCLLGWHLGSARCAMCDYEDAAAIEAIRETLQDFYDEGVDLLRRECAG